MPQGTRLPANAFVATARRVYHPLGFKKGYNFILFVHTVGALLGFTLSRLMYLDIDIVFCGPGFSTTNRAFPGACYHYRKLSADRVGIIMHLACILPAALLVCLQFVPVIRHKFLLFHRINGYIVLVLSTVGIIAVFLMLRHSMGGTPMLQVSGGMASIWFLFCVTMAFVNIKRLQIEQHRAWMLRAWAVASAIITLRPILIITAKIITLTGGYYMPFPCTIIEYLVTAVGPAFRTAELYPACEAYIAGRDPDAWALVRADMKDNDSPLGSAAALQHGFSVGSVLAFGLHAILVEVYLHLTPAETERLRRVSYQRQLQAGMRTPGSAGLTAERLGDAEKWSEREAERLVNEAHASKEHGSTAGTV